MVVSGQATSIETFLGTSACNRIFLEGKSVGGFGLGQKEVIFRIFQ